MAGRLSLDRAWFSSITEAPVWSIRVRAQATLAVTAGSVTLVALGAAARFASKVEPAEGSAPNRLVNRYRDRMGPAHGWLLGALPIVLAARAAVAASGRWQAWLLLLHGPNLGSEVPGVGMDLGYHLFRLPMLGVVSSWLRGLVLTALAIIVVGMTANGALKIHRGERRSSSSGLRVLAALAATFGVLQSLHYVFVQAPSLARGRFGSFDGAGFTQVDVLRPSLWVLAVVALATAFGVVVAARSERWVRVAIVLASWGLLHLVLIVGIPIAVDAIVVAPAEATRQLPFISENLDATRAAFGLDRVELSSAAITDGLSAEPAVSAGLDRVPLFGESQMVTPLQVLQGTTATRITDVDLDRYDIDGTVRPVLVAARSASASDLPESGWVQKHLVYTHGDGVVLIPADTTDESGQPDLNVLAQMGEAARPEMYFGEGLDGWYVVTGTKRTELGGSAFEGGSGIPLDSTWARMRLALATGEFEPLVSSELLPESQVLYRRAVRERLGQLAPFLALDANAYPVLVDDRIVWVVDGYTTSASYPYAQHLRSAGLPAASGLSGRTINYVHASVKATVDAYDGTVHLYRTGLGGADDPILDVWDALMPGLFEPIDDMPRTVREHLLYPQDFLTAQTAMLGRYHVTDPELLFSGAESWAISAAAGTTVVQASNEATTSAGPSPAVSLFMPEGGPLGGHWVAIRPFGPGSAENPTSVRDELSAIAIADHDNPERLQLLEFVRVPGRLVSSPLVAQTAIDTDGDLAAEFTLLNANGSVVEFGPMTPLVLGDSLTWVRSIVVTDAASITTPRFFGVAAVSGGSVGQADSVSAALSDALAAQ
jgi:uncharacterized membrane protein (UPF0182 family)